MQQLSEAKGRQAAQDRVVEDLQAEAERLRVRLRERADAEVQERAEREGLFRDNQ